jgi:hypothetical protein
LAPVFLQTVGTFRPKSSGAVFAGALEFTPL